MITSSCASNENIRLNLEKLTWADVREELYKVNPELTKKCDHINKFNKYPVYKLKYAYGLSIIHEGEFYLPTLDSKTISINDTRVPESLKQSLAYSSLPLACIINNSCEVFVQEEQRIIPLNFLETGELFGLFELMCSLTQTSIVHKTIWNVSAGARSVFMLPSVSNVISYRRIYKKFNINDCVPKEFNDQHWSIFCNINNSNKQNTWETTILVFSKEWFEHQNNIAYIELYKYLVNKCWEQLQLLKEFSGYSKLWLLFTRAINKRNIKPRTYIIDTVKHLISITQGLGVAFVPSIDDTALPKNLIQQVYIKDYNLKNYIPNIMQPAKFIKGGKLYYSLSVPTISNSSSHCNNPPSIIEDQRNIKSLLNILMEVIYDRKNRLNADLENIQFEYFHSQNDEFQQIVSSSIIPETDPRFLKCNNDYTDNRVFCASSSFFKGCIRIS
ncbi:hypothetical protein [Rickettsia endosymbiont of Pantilius tunicatus]|uniref:hypothetical protein n=1 Tax=Rickettsia endosymbiont of Pantilius tunicatus TaxID=3066267 RepID=UPI00376EB703